MTALSPGVDTYHKVSGNSKDGVPILLLWLLSSVNTTDVESMEKIERRRISRCWNKDTTLLP